MERIARDYSSIEIVSSLDCVVLNSFYQTRHYLHLVGDRSVKGGVEIKPQEEIGVKTKFLGSSVRIQKLSDYCSEVEAKIPFVWESAEHARFLQEVTSPNFDYRNPHTIRKVVEYKGVQLEFWDGLGNVLVDSNYRTNNLCWYSAPFDLLTEDNLDQEKPHENLVDLNSNRDFCSYGESFLRFDNKYKFDNYIINLEIRTIIVFCDIWIRNTSVSTKITLHTSRSRIKIGYIPLSKDIGRTSPLVLIQKQWVHFSRLRQFLSQNFPYFIHRRSSSEIWRNTFGHDTFQWFGPRGVDRGADSLFKGHFSENVSINHIIGLFQCEYFPQYHAETVHVGSLVVWLAVVHFWRHVSKGSRITCQLERTWLVGWKFSC